MEHSTIPYPLKAVSWLLWDCSCYPAPSSYNIHINKKSEWREVNIKHIKPYLNSTISSNTIMVSPKKWYKPNPYKSASDGGNNNSSFGKSSTMVLLLVVQAILCSLYLYYGETSHDYGSSSNDNITTFNNNDDAPQRVVVSSSVKDDTTTNVNENKGGSSIILHYKKPTKRYTRTIMRRWCGHTTFLLTKKNRDVPGRAFRLSPA